MRSLTVKGLPAGWKVLQLARGRNNPYDAVVLCERTDEPMNPIQFVTWRANLEIGGCSLGHYCSSYEEANLSFNKRKVVLR